MRLWRTEILLEPGSIDDFVVDVEAGQGQVGAAELGAGDRRLAWVRGADGDAGRALLGRELELAVVPSPRQITLPGGAGGQGRVQRPSRCRRPASRDSGPVVLFGRRPVDAAPVAEPVVVSGGVGEVEVAVDRLAARLRPGAARAGFAFADRVVAEGGRRSCWCRSRGGRSRCLRSACRRRCLRGRRRSSRPPSPQIVLRFITKPV